MLACSACGAENPDAASFCMSCGRPLELPAAGREERKIVSVIFVDLVGFTSRAENLDVEDVRGTLQPYHDTLRAALQRFGGTVEKFIGDAVMAVFGAPVAREDDAERAVRAAFAIHDDVAGLGLDLHVRIGVCTGEVLVALDAQPERGEAMVSGDVVNTAARLQGLAPTDGVLVDEATYRATERTIVYADHEPVLAKGKADPVACWLGQRPRSLLPVAARETVPFVGRQRERRMLVDAFERSRADGSVELVTIVGVPGIGKTRLVAELRAHIEDEPQLTTWRQGRVLSYGDGVAFWALADIVKQQAGILESDEAADIAAKLDAALRGIGLEGDDAVWVRRHLAPLVGVESTGERGGREEAFAGWRMFIEAIAEDCPTVMLIEDLHWADDALLDFVDDLSSRVANVPLLIICTTRPELWERRSSWGGGKPNALTISLQKLSPAETQELVSTLIDPTLLALEGELELLERADGNPLYAQEYVRTLVERGADATALPATVQGIIAARLDALSPDEKSLLQDAAVFGRTAWLGALCAIGGRDPDKASELVFRLERKQLLQRVGRSSVAGEVELTFTHALIEEVAYSQLTRAQRADRHERAADWIENLAGQAGHVEIVAHHLSTAIEISNAIGRDATGLRSRAVVALAKASQQAASRYDIAATITLTTAALALDPEPELGAELIVRRAVAHDRVGTATEQMLIQARDAAIAAGREVDAVLALVMLATMAEDDADMVKFDAYLDEAFRMVSTLPPGPTTGLVAYLRSYRLLVQGEMLDLVTFADAQIALARAAGDEQAAALTMTWRGAARINLGDLDGLRDSQEACAILERHAHPKVAVQLGNLAELYRVLGLLDKSRDEAEKGLAWARRIGDQRVEKIQIASLALDDFLTGDIEAAHRHAGLAMAIPTQGGFADDFVRLISAKIATTSPNPAAAISDALSALEFADANENDQGRLEGNATLALLRERSGDRAGAKGACDAFLERWHAVGGMQGEILTLMDVAVVLAAQDRHQELADAIVLLPMVTPWSVAATAIAERRYDDAVATLDTIGAISLRDAVSRLAAGAL